MSSIFLSHSSQDNPVAEQVKARLEQWGHRSVFLDFDPAEGIPAGRDWEKELYAKLRECRALIILCSHASMASRWCFAEITHAKAMGKPVFPIKLDDAQVDQVLTSVQVIDATTGWDTAYQHLEKGLLAAGLDPKNLFDWDTSRPPYPGLLAFQEQDAAIFFGRDKEIREGQALLNRLQQFGGPRLTLMLGASGSGKSSLMRAGLLPRLKRDLRWVVIEPFRPLKAPFDELALVLSERFSQVAKAEKRTPTDVAQVRERIQWDEHEAQKSIDTFLGLITELRETPESRDATVLLMIDQCEELLATGANEEGKRFLAFLRAVLDREDSHLMVLATLRSDFFGSFQEHPAMRGLGVKTFAVPQMAVDDFASVIEGPARIAGLQLGPGLVQAVVSDTKTADALPLLAFTLRELYESFGVDKLLTLEEYRDKLGRLDGCIGRAAEAVLSAKSLSEKELSDLRNALLSMVRVNDRDQYAKQPVSWRDLPASSHDVLERFVTARLLISSVDEKGRTLEVAHEALFRAWPELKGWVKSSAVDLRLIDYEEEAAQRWHETGRHLQELWRKERADTVQQALTRFKKGPSAWLQTMLQPQQMLIERLEDGALSHKERLLIGLKLAEFGDPRPGVGVREDGVPDIAWIDIPGGQVYLEGSDREVKPFRMAKYLVTNAQFDAFLKADDGYDNDEWWIGMRRWPNGPGHVGWTECNAPRETVSWFAAVAFCRWISHRNGATIRLPSELEWQRAGTGGNPQFLLPWGQEWDSSRCNSMESRLQCTTSVGMYPAGATRQGLLDMTGNVWEWCLNAYKDPCTPEALGIGADSTEYTNRGGSWSNPSIVLPLNFRNKDRADFGDNGVGFRLAQDIP